MTRPARPTSKVTPAQLTVYLKPRVSMGAGNRIRARIKEARILRAQTLAARMKERGQTMTSISRDTGIDLSYVSRIFSGARMPGLDTTMRLARVMGYTVEELANILIPDLDLVHRETGAGTTRQESGSR